MPKKTCENCRADCCRGALSWVTQLVCTGTDTNFPSINGATEVEVCEALLAAEETWHCDYPTKDRPSCPLLDSPGDCTIYASRPPLCRVWHCNWEHWVSKDFVMGKVVETVVIDEPAFVLDGGSYVPFPLIPPHPIEYEPNTNYELKGVLDA